MKQILKKENMRKIKYLFLALMLTLNACTLSFNNISTEGKAEDVLDEQQSTDPKIDPVLDIPSTIV